MTCVSVIDSSTEFCKSIKTCIDKESSLKCLGCHSYCDEALLCLPKEHPDVILMDVDFPCGMPGKYAIKTFKKKLPSTKIIVLSNNTERKTIFKALNNGAAGYLKKNSSFEEIVDVIRTVSKGRRALIDLDILGRLLNKSAPEPGDLHLSCRERTALEFICDSLTNKQIADRLFINKSGIKSLINRHPWIKHFS